MSYLTYAEKTHVVQGIPGLISFWSFSEEAGQNRIASLGYPYQLQEANGAIQRVDDGVFGPHSAKINHGQRFLIPRAECPELNIYGKNGLTVIAWIIRRKKPVNQEQGEFIAGLWNEFGQRQYGLFINLRTGAVRPEYQGLDEHGYAEQVIGHVSDTGQATPGFEWCRSGSFSASTVPWDSWQCIAMSYDGHYACSYLNGIMEPRPHINPFALPDGIYNPGDDGSDFYVGANPVPGYGIANKFVGNMGGLAVYNRALTDKEMLSLAFK